MPFQSGKKYLSCFLSVLTSKTDSDMPDSHVIFFIFFDGSLWTYSLCDERTILNIENDRGNPKFEVLCQIIAYLHIPADRIFHPDTATDGVKKQKLLLMLQECDEQEAAEILPAIEYLLALIHKRGNSNE